MYEVWRFGDVYICHPAYGGWATDQPKPKMWKLKCFEFFLKRLADLERVLQSEEKREEVNIMRVDMCESLMEEMAVEEQKAMEECRMAERQRVRWADMEDGQKGEKGEELASVVKGQAVVVETETERLMGQVTAGEEDRPEGERDEKREEEKQETAEERGQMDEEALAAVQEEVHREREIGIAWRKKRISSSGKNGNGRARVRTLERRIFVWRAGFQGLNGVQMPARHAVRLSRGGVRSQSKKQMGQESMSPRGRRR